MTAPDNESPKPVVGIIGGIGGGKSLAAREFVQLGGYLISADELGHEALRQPKIRAQVVQHWGGVVVNEIGEIDRRCLAGIVFAQTDERRALEEMVFPHIERRIEEEAKRGGSAECSFIVLDAAVMCEAGWDRWCDWLVYVHTPDDVRYQRLAVHRNWNVEEIRRREKAQMPLDEKRRRADAVIDNGTSPDRVRDQVKKLAQQWNLVPNEGRLSDGGP